MPILKLLVFIAALILSWCWVINGFLENGFWVGFQKFLLLLLLGSLFNATYVIYRRKTGK